jgi:hypothetical protein
MLGLGLFRSKMKLIAAVLFFSFLERLAVLYWSVFVRYSRIQLTGKSSAKSVRVIHRFLIVGSLRMTKVFAGVV